MIALMSFIIVIAACVPFVVSPAPVANFFQARTCCTLLVAVAAKLTGHILGVFLGAHDSFAAAFRLVRQSRRTAQHKECGGDANSSEKCFHSHNCPLQKF